MRHQILALMLVLGWAAGCVPAYAGCCFGWDHRGQSACREAVASAAECSTWCADAAWEQAYFIDSDSCGCMFGGYRNVPWSYYDADTSWRYVVVVWCAPDPQPGRRCDTTASAVCWERQILYRCKMNPQWPT